MKKFILSTIEEPHCMNCKLQWSYEFLFSVLPKTFINTTYKIHKTNSLISNEKQFLQATIPLIIRQKKVEEKKNEIQALKTIKKDLQKQIHDANTLLLTKQRELNQIENGTFDNIEHHDRIRKCCKEECHGFLDTNFKCSACECIVCSECNEVKDEIDIHVCNPDTVINVQALLAISKPCPSCGTMICKAHGCDQMWCPECQTTFSWNTGQVSRGNTHNPHYFEWLRQNGLNTERNLMDIPCGGVPSRTGMLDMLCKLLDSNTMHLENKFITIHEVAEDIERYEMRRYALDDDQLNNQLTTFRINYLTNKITEDQWKHKLQKIDKRNSKNKEILQIMQTFVTIVSDSYRQLITYNDSLKLNMEEELNTILLIIKFYNDRLAKVSKMYSSKVPSIHPTHFRITMVKLNVL
jgi:hypothetical protein